MMKRKFLILVCGVLLLCFLFGCQLAKEYDGPHNDRMIGVFITTEHLDLSPYDMFANLTIITLTSVDTGETLTTAEYDFPQLIGISFFSPVVAVASTNDSFTTTKIDEAISNGHVAIHVGDNNNSKTLSGTIFVTHPNETLNFYINPVFQESTGGIYVVSGDAISVTAPSGTGAAMTHSMESVHTTTENGVTTTDSFSITITISTIPAPEKIRIIQMSADNVLISQADFDPREVPAEYSPEEDTAYIIVETHSRDETGSDIIIREIHNRGDEYIDTFYVRADDICVMRQTQLIW